MIDFYTFGSTNGHKVAIALEELGFRTTFTLWTSSQAKDGRQNS